MKLDEQTLFLIFTYGQVYLY